MHSLRECLFGELAVGSGVVLDSEPPKTTRRSELSTVAHSLRECLLGFNSRSELTAAAPSTWDSL